MLLTKKSSENMQEISIEACQIKKSVRKRNIKEKDTT